MLPPKVAQELQQKGAALHNDLQAAFAKYGTAVSSTLCFELTEIYEGQTYTCTMDVDYNVSPARRLGIASAMKLKAEQKILAPIVPIQAPPIKGAVN